MLNIQYLRLRSLLIDLKKVITCALRTPLTKAGRGGLKDTAMDELLVHVLKVRDDGIQDHIRLSI